MDVKTLCLGLLSEGDLTGYEIKKRCEESFRHFFLVGFGSIYPALAELARAGLVEVREDGQKGRPERKVYRITEPGRARLEQELMEAEPRHKVRSEFLALMFFAHLLPAERVAEILDQRIAEWEQLLTVDLETIERKYDGPESCRLTPGQRFALGYGRTVLTAALAYCKRHRAELVRALEATEAEAADPPAATAAGNQGRGRCGTSSDAGGAALGHSLPVPGE